MKIIHNMNIFRVGLCQRKPQDGLSMTSAAICIQEERMNKREDNPRLTCALSKEYPESCFNEDKGYTA